MSLFTLLRRAIGDQRGSVSAYMAVFGTIIVGGAALAVDLGRMTVLKGQLQDAADSRALAAAVQLDTLPGARARASDMALNAAVHDSAFDTNDGFQVAEVNFYSSIDPFVASATDVDASFVEVVMVPADINFLFEPVLHLLAGTPDAQRATTVNASAIATQRPFVCQVPPLAICDFAEDPNESDLRLPENHGRMVRLKPPLGNDFWTPGNFGLLEPPSGSGAKQVEENLAAVTPDGCFSEIVTTEPGQKTNKVVDAINSRFDLNGNPWPHPAPNVITYPRDNNMIADDTLALGNGEWDSQTYWSEKHGSPLPPALANATRFQTYLYELGETFGRNGNQTYYPVTDAMPADFTEVVPPATDIPESASNPNDPDHDGMPRDPNDVAENGPDRRLVQVAQLQCIAEGLKGSSDADTDGNYISVFLTEYSKSPPDAAIYGEVVGPLTAVGSEKKYSNVQLVK